MIKDNDKTSEKDSSDEEYYTTHDDKQVDCNKNPDDAFCDGEKGRNGYPFCDVVDDAKTCYDRNDDEIGYCKQYGKDDKDFCKIIEGSDDED